MIHLSTPWIIFLRVFLAGGVTYLAIVDTLKFIWMRRVVSTMSDHTETLASQTRQMKALAKQVAAALQFLAGPQPPSALGGPRLVEKTKVALAKSVRDSRDILLAEEHDRAN